MWGRVSPGERSGAVHMNPYVDLYIRRPHYMYMTRLALVAMAAWGARMG